MLSGFCLAIAGILDLIASIVDFKADAVWDDEALQAATDCVKATSIAFLSTAQWHFSFKNWIISKEIPEVLAA